MRGLTNLATATLVSLVTNSVALPMIIYPGHRHHLSITFDNTVNNTGVNSESYRGVGIGVHTGVNTEVNTGAGEGVHTGVNTGAGEGVNTGAGTGLGTGVNKINGIAINSTLGSTGSVGSAHPLPISILNNLGGNDSLTAYITGKDSAGAVVFLSPDGSFYHPDAGGSTDPVRVVADVGLPIGGLGSTTTFTVPDYISSARIWVAAGSLEFFTVTLNGVTALVEPSPGNLNDPSAGVNWGIVELSNDENGAYANLSFVDFVGLIMGMSLTLGSGAVQRVKGLAKDAIASICTDLEAQTALDGQPWKGLCVRDSSGKPLRVLSPNIYAGIYPEAMSGYFSDFSNQVWVKYASEPLIINTQSAAGNVTCRVNGLILQCDGDNRGYFQPVANDVWGCNSGPFAMAPTDNAIHGAVVPRLCAAFERGTLLLPGGNVQPSLGNSSYYKNSPCNHYSRLVHKYESDGLGYAFSYDDVNPTGENEAGVVAGLDPKLLQITLGGFV